METAHDTEDGCLGKTTPVVPIAYRIVALMQERNRLFTYPLEQVAADIWATRFRCTSCGACCTQAINNHIFLLDRDVERVKTLDPEAYEPAPDPEFCDQNGMLYVSGYALRMKKDTTGSCWFLEGGRCRIYEQRFSVCRIYPHMLRRSAGVPGNVTWRQFARKGSHGQYDPTFPFEECLTIAQEVKEYETAYLNQQISFLETIHEYFMVHNLRQDPVMHKDRMQRLLQGDPVDINVFHEGELEECRVSTTGDFR
ncbi:MAG: YkgJ family cysteine cluster protein [Methanoregula sp.]|nr:YkgJ family cysteine cluster protein [Methanoregula sp.]